MGGAPLLGSAMILIHDHFGLAECGPRRLGDTPDRLEHRPMHPQHQGTMVT